MDYLGTNYEDCVEVYYGILRTIMSRKGLYNFTDWLHNETDFLSAPASTRFHGAVKGGLLSHSLCVYYNLMGLICKKYSKETVFVTAMYHDICKVNTYKESFRNVKNESGVWVKQPCYTFEEDYPFGAHGGKSVYLLMSHGIELTDEEAAAINCHMGGWDTTTYHNPGGAFAKYPLAVYLHIADMLASYIDKA